MNLREDKHWSYGAGSQIADARGARPFLVYAPVQTDKTAESMAEIQHELTAIAGETPPTSDELARVKDLAILSLPGRWETASAVMGSISEIEQFGLEANYWDTYPERIRELDVPVVSDAIRKYIFPQRLVWVVVGDWSHIEDGVRALGLGEIHQVNLAGTPVG
jgi:zinc protease